MARQRKRSIGSEYDVADRLSEPVPLGHALMFMCPHPDMILFLDLFNTDFTGLNQRTRMTREQAEVVSDIIFNQIKTAAGK